MANDVTFTEEDFAPKSKFKFTEDDFQPSPTPNFAPEPIQNIVQTPGERPLGEPWFAEDSPQSPIKGAVRSIVNIPGRLLETIGTATEVGGPLVEGAVGDPRFAKSPAEIIQGVQRNPIFRAGRSYLQTIGEEAEKQVPLSEEEKASFFTKAGESAGSMLPYVVARQAAPALIGLESFADHLTNDFEQEKAKGRNEDEAANIAFAKAIGSGVLQTAIFKYVPPQLRKLGEQAVTKFGVGLVTNFLAKRAAQSGETAAVFALSRAGENIVSGKSPLEGLGEAAAGGAALGVVTPYGPTATEQRNYFKRRLPQAPPGAEPPVIPGEYVPPEPGPSALTQVIPPGGTMPQRTRIRLTLDLPRKSGTELEPAVRLMGGEVITHPDWEVGSGITHNDIIDKFKIPAIDIDQRGFIDRDKRFFNREEAATATGLPTQFTPGRLQSDDLPTKQEIENATQKRKIEESNLGQYPGTAPRTPVLTDEEKIRQAQSGQAGGGNRPVGVPEGQAPDQTLLATAPEQIASMSGSEYMTFRNKLGKNTLPAQQAMARASSPVKIRQFAQQAADEYTRAKNQIAQMRGTAAEKSIQDIQGVAGKLQFFNEVLREAGEPPVQPAQTTVETQVGRAKKPSGGRTPGMTPREVGLIQREEKLENDWSVATQTGKVNVNADELKTNDAVVVRGEPLTVTNVSENGEVTLRGEKGGRWGERKLQPGQQIGVDEFRQGKEEGFEPEKSKPPEAAAQKYRLKDAGPQLYSLIERLPQSEAEKAAGEQAIRVRNDKTGKEETVLEIQLQPVKLRTAEERAASKGLSKRELDDALRKFGMEPSEFSNAAQKREALKRARAKGRELSLSFSPTEFPLLNRVKRLWEEYYQQYGYKETDAYYDERLEDALSNPDFIKAQNEAGTGFTGPRGLEQLISNYLGGFERNKGDGDLVKALFRIEPELRELAELRATKTQTRLEGFALAKISETLGTDPKPELVKDPQVWADVRGDIWRQDPGLGAWVDDVLFPDKFKYRPDREAAFANKRGTVLLGKPIELATPEDIGRAVADPKLNITNAHRKALDWLASSGMMEKLPGLRLEIVDYIRGGAAGEYIGDESVARFLRWTDAEVPIHEFLHHVWRYLDEADRAFISDLRLQEIALKAPQMGDTFRIGMPSDYFIAEGFNRDLYHLSNDSEFFVWLMSEKALREMNRPQAVTFAEKIRGIIRDLWNGFKDALGLSKYQDTLWREIIDNRYQYREEDGLRFAETVQDRNLALVRSRRDAAERTINYDDMSDTQKKDIGSDVELQNTFVEPLADRLVTGRSRGIVSKLQKIFGDRLAALAEVRGRGDRHDVLTYEQLIENPGIDSETKQIIVGDMEKNVRDFRDTAERTIVLSDAKIQDYQQKIIRLTEDLDVQKARRDVLARAARRIVSDYQNRYLDRIRQGGQAGEAAASAEVMRNLQQLKQSPEIIGRIIDQIAATVPQDILTRPGITAPELLQALIQNNGGNLETLSAALGEAQRGVGREMLQTAIGVMQASDQLAENVLAIRSTINPEDVQAIQSLAVELRNAATRGARSDLRELVRDVGGTAESLSTVRGAIGRLQPRIRRAARQLSEWLTTQDILEQARNDPAFKELERKVYSHFDVRSVAVKEGGDYEFTIKNPLTNEDVKILVGLDRITSGENYAKLQKLFDDAAAYLANPSDRNYDPRLAAAWRYMIDNAQQFWLNPSTNVFMPHMTPFQFDLPAFLSDPWKVLRTNAGLEANAAQVKLNAMSKVKKMLMEWDRKTGATVDIANKKAARAANTTLNDWYERVFDEVAFRHQYLGQVLPRVGDILLSGHKVTALDMAALKTNFDYLRRVREIAENTDSFTAAGINPARVIQGGISRRAEPTGAMTLPSKRSVRALNWGREWRRLPDWIQRMNWLNDPERFNQIVVGHMDTYRTPGYTVPSRWREFYRGIVDDIKREDGPETIQEIAERLYESQDLDELGPNAATREQIEQELVGEIDRGFRNFQAEDVTRQTAKPDPEIDALTAENSFTKPRSDKVTSPFTFYDYGVRDYPGRLRMGNDAYVWYGLDFVEALKRLQSALNRRIDELTRGLKPTEERAVQKATRKAQLRGDEMFDLAELKLNAKRIKSLLDQQTRVLKSSRAGRTSLESAFFRAQTTVGSLILMTPGARATHTFGMMGNSGVFNALIENRVVRPAAKAWIRLVTAGVKDILKIPVSIPGLKVTNEQLRSWPGIAQSYAEMVINRREQMDRLKEQAMVPESHFVGAWKSMLEDWRNVFRRESPETLSTRIGSGLIGLSDAYNAAAMSYAPQRYNDWVLNSNMRAARNDFVLRLQENALKHIRNRSEVLGTGYSDFSRPENVLTAQEITGRKGPGAEREAFEKRRLFKSLGMDLDQIMLRYFRAVDEAQANGTDTGQIPFLTEAEGKSLDWEFAQGFGLSTPGTRNLAAQGSGLLRRGAGYIHGLPLSTMGRYLSLFNRLSNQTSPKYAAAIAYPVLAASLYMTMMGLLKIQSTATLNRIFYKQSSALPTIVQAKTPDDFARLMLRSFAIWFPIAGDIVLGAVLRTPDRLGHLDSMFVMYNFLQDLVNTGGDIWHTKDISGTLMKFGERWMPPVKILTRRLQSQTGVREHYNAVADIQSALPPGMESAASKFRGGIRPTETTPLTYKALNAMYNGNWDEFNQISQQYAAKKTEQGVKDGFLAFKHSIAAHNPWIERLGKLPTDDERQQILSRMDDTQRKEVEKAENTFREFGQRYGTRVAFTQQQAEAEKGAAGGGGEPTAGIGNVKVGGAGAGALPRGITVPRGTLPQGLRRISVGSVVRPASFIGGRTPRVGLSPRRAVSSSGPGRAQRFVIGKLRVSRPRIGRRRLGLGKRKSRRAIV